MDKNPLTMRFLVAILAASLAWPLAAGAQDGGENSLADAMRAEADAWRAAPFTIPVALFVKARASGFGMYDARENSNFEPGEKLRFYLEPRGYKFRANGDLVSFGVTMDIVLASPDGTVLFQQDGFLNQDFVSHHANEELMLNGDLDITGTKPGEYVLQLTVHDKIGSGAASAKLPFSIR